MVDQKESVEVYTVHTRQLSQGALMCANVAQKNGLTEKQNCIPKLRECVFFRPLSPTYVPADEMCLALSVDPRSMKVYDQEFHATKGTLKGEHSMCLHDYLQLVKELLADPCWDYVYWPILNVRPQKCRLPFQQSHLENPTYIMTRSSVGRVIHEVRVFRDSIPLQEFRKVV